MNDWEEENKKNKNKINQRYKVIISLTLFFFLLFQLLPINEFTYTLALSTFSCDKHPVAWQEAILVNLIYINWKGINVRVKSISSKLQYKGQDAIYFQYSREIIQQGKDTLSIICTWDNMGMAAPERIAVSNKIKRFN